MKFLKSIPVLLLLLSTQLLIADVNDDEKVKILTQYLVEKEHKDVISARNEAIATVYGKPKLQDLVYNDPSEMFFGNIISEKGNFKKAINFYMPRQRAIEFQRNVDAGKIEIEHAFDDNEIVVKTVEVDYRGVTYPLNFEEPNTITFKIGGYFLARQDTDVLAQKNGIGGIINLQDFFNMNEKTNVFRLDVNYHFAPNHALEFSYYTINNSNSKVVVDEFEWEGYYIKNGTLTSRFDTDIYKLNYIYSAYKTNKIDLSFRAGLHITGLRTGLTGKVETSHQGTINLGEDSDVKLTAPLPVLGFGLNYKIIPSVHVNYTVDYFFLSFEDVQGSLVDSLLSIDYKYNRYFGAGLGLNVTNMKVKADVQDIHYEVRNEVTGLLAYLILSY